MIKFEKKGVACLFMVVLGNFILLVKVAISISAIIKLGWSNLSLMNALIFKPIKRVKGGKAVVENVRILIKLDEITV